MDWVRERRRRRIRSPDTHAPNEKSPPRTDEDYPPAELLPHHRLEQRSVPAPHDRALAAGRVTDDNGVRRHLTREDHRVPNDRGRADVVLVQGQWNACRSPHGGMKSSLPSTHSRRPSIRGHVSTRAGSKPSGAPARRGSRRFRATSPRRCREGRASPCERGYWRVLGASMDTTVSRRAHTRSTDRGTEPRRRFTRRGRRCAGGTRRSRTRAAPPPMPPARRA